MADLTAPGKSPEVTATATEFSKSPNTLPKSPNLLKSSTFMPPAALRRPSTQFRIASSYNIRDEPKFDPVALSEPIKEDHELEDYGSGSETASESVTSSGRKVSFLPVLGGQKTRARSISAEEAGRKKSTPGSPTQRRRSTVVAEKPSNVITWKGVDDPENPRNWPRARKWRATVIISLFTFMAPVASSMIAPSTREMGLDLGIKSKLQEDMQLSIFILAFAIGPLIFGPLSEVFGRIPVLQATNLFYLIFNLACGFAQNGTQMLVFRFLSGLGGSAPSAIGGGVLGDCWWPDERGAAIAAYSLAPLLGPAVGPIAGGFIAGSISWRWVFWISTMADVVIQILGLFFLQETYPPRILHQKVKRMRKATGNYNLKTEYETEGKTLLRRIGENIQRPFRMLLTQPIVQAMALYMAFVYGLTFLTYATFTTLWTSKYGERMGISGLHYIALSVGFAVGTQILAPCNDRIYHFFKVKNGGVGQPEFRCPLMLLGTGLLSIGLFWYGWSANAKMFWLMPDIGIGIFATGCDICFQCMSSYIIDSYARYAASALAAMVVLRSFAAFGFPLFAPKMFDALGYGWTTTILACIAIAIGMPAPFLLWKYGPALRKRSTFAAGD